MFNAKLSSKNFGGRWSMLTLMPAKPAAMNKNLEAASTLLSSAEALGKRMLGGVSTKARAFTFEALLLEASNAELIKFLRASRWLETDYVYPAQPADVGLQIEFLEKQNHGIKSWLIVAPQRKTSFGAPFSVKGVGDFAVKLRNRIPDRGFKVFGEVDHRMVAGFLAEVTPDEPDKPRLASASAPTQSLYDPRRGIVLFYPVRERETDVVSVGFELLFPLNNLPFDLNFTVRRKAESARIVVDDSEGD
jgi:hypothetical protein